MATTTMAAVRGRMIALVKAIQPTLLAMTDNVDFLPFENDDPKANFVDWAQANPQACFRRFLIRDTGERGLPDVTNTDVETVIPIFEFVCAYPHSLLYGSDGALDRDVVMDEDERLIGNVIGLHGYGNFVDPNPSASLIGDPFITRVQGSGVDFLFMRLPYRFYRAR